jgi:hypothetical protein
LERLENKLNYFFVDATVPVDPPVTSRMKEVWSSVSTRTRLPSSAKKIRRDAVCKQEFIRLLESAQVIHGEFSSPVRQAQPVAIAGDLRPIAEPFCFLLSRGNRIKEHAVPIVRYHEPVSRGLLIFGLKRNFSRAHHDSSRHGSGARVQNFEEVVSIPRIFLVPLRLQLRGAGQFITQAFRPGTSLISRG